MAWIKLTAEEVSLTCNPLEFEFETTEDVPPLDDIIGQERAVKAMDFGLRIKRHGYNIYISGLTGTGRNSYAQSMVKDIAAVEKLPDDWCYVYNFKHPGEPVSINLPAGEGNVFVSDIDSLMEDLREAIPEAFDSEDYEKKKAEYLKAFQEVRGALLEKLNKIASDKGFSLKKTSGGFITIPVIDGKQVDEEAYEDLDSDVKEDFEKRSNEVQIDAMEVLRKIQAAEKELKEKIKVMDTKIGLMSIGYLFEGLKEKYTDNTKIISYLNQFQQDILDNINSFRTEEEEQQNPFSFIGRQGKEQLESRYRVNLLVDNSSTEGAPVVIEHNPSYYNLIGKVEYENRMGMVITDFTMIKGGALHRANGGYLIIQARDVLIGIQAWEALKRTLKTKEICIENIAEHYGLIAMSSLRPEPVPLNLKVIIIGSPMIYHLLYHYDEDFRKLFKIKADFDVEMERDRINMTKMASFISTHCQKEKLKHFDRRAVSCIVDYGSRIAERREKLSTRFNEIVELVYEADAWAELAGDKLVTEDHVKKAVEERVFRSNKYEKKLLELIEKEQILIDVEGKKSGQINGLAVIDMGDYSFGRPSRITASTYLGRKGIINIERESKLGGNIHNKGVYIISGYMGMRYARKEQLTLSASICFEQSYGGVDGDSASVAELVTLLSSMADVPLKQSIAVTGSVNQKGEVQPVGGINYKVEGFYHACKINGLTGEQGVIIPASNALNLVLSHEVSDAIRDGKFSVYTVSSVDDAIELLTDLKAGEIDEDGKFPKGSFNRLVQDKLQLYNNLIKEKVNDESDKDTAGNNGDS